MAIDDHEKFGVMEGARRVWTVGAVHGEFAHLSALHGMLEARFARGDRLVYLGNFIGATEETPQKITSCVMR